jgi:hypothetical protein
VQGVFENTSALSRGMEFQSAPKMRKQPGKQQPGACVQTVRQAYLAKEVRYKM